MVLTSPTHFNIWIRDGDGLLAIERRDGGADQSPIVPRSFLRNRPLIEDSV